MRRSLALAVVAAVLVPALLAVVAPRAMVRAQEGPSPEEEKLDEMIRSLSEALAAKQAAAGGGKSLVFETRFYDVRDLLHPIADRPVYRAAGSLVPSGGFGFGLSEEAGEPVVAWEPDGLAELVRYNIAPSSWDELQSAHADCTSEGVLVVRHVAAVHDRVAALLASLRARAAAQVLVEARVLAVPDALLRSILPEPGEYVLSAVDEGAIEKALAEGAASQERSGSVLCTSTQRVGLADGSEVAYVQDYDVEIAQKAHIGDPIVQILNDGLTLDVRPVVTGEGDLVLLDVQADFAVCRKPLPAFETPLGSLDTPTVDLSIVRTTLVAPAGRWAVAGGSLGGGGRLLLVRATVMRPDGR